MPWLQAPPRASRSRLRPPRRLTSEHPEQGPPRHPDRTGRLREELRAPRREHVHLHRSPGRQPDRDQDRGRAGVRRQCHLGQHDHPPGHDASSASCHGHARQPTPSNRTPRDRPTHRDILIAPVVSEKSYALLDANKYTFIVRPDANKTEIKIAVEKVFDVKVTSVNTINRQGKTRRTRFGMGKRANTKRAIVSLAEGHRIDIFGGPVS